MRAKKKVAQSGMKKSARKAALDSEAARGLVLAWLATRGAQQAPP